MAITTTTLVFAVVAAAVVGWVAFTRRRSGSIALPNARLRDVPKVYELIVAARNDGSFGVFLFGKNGSPPANDGALNVQFSIEDGRVGLDWVSNGQLNDLERARVEAFFRDRGAPMSPKSMNGISYIRTESGDLPTLAQDLLRTVFGVTDEQGMLLITEGFAAP